MVSIRSKLIVWLWLSLTLLVVAIGIWNYFNTKHQLVNFFDTELVQTQLSLKALHQQLLHTSINNPGELLNNLVNQHPALSKNFPHDLQQDFLTYQLPQVFQIWDADNNLIYKSQLAPIHLLTAQDPAWHVMTFSDQQWTYVVAEPVEVRNAIIRQISIMQELPLFCLWIILLLFSWWLIRICIAPLNKIDRAIAMRQSGSLEPLDTAYIPDEIKPLVLQINQLFVRLENSIQREKRFTADAAHELRTPLAALKVQAQVALGATDELSKADALNKVILGVDRCTHLVEQLSILARLKPNEALHDVTDVDLANLTREVIADLAPYFADKEVDVEFTSSLPQPVVQGNRALLGVMLRNIIDNAIRYSNSHTKVSVEIFQSEKNLIIRVQDQGPGIPVELHERVFEQFYRGHIGVGSGLGLSIVDQIAKLHNAGIKLAIPKNQGYGLCFDVVFLKK